MTSFRPCFGCIARGDCEIKKGAVKALRGIPVTLAKIKCDLPFTLHFPPGVRASVKVWDHRDEGHATEDFGYDVSAKMAPATVVGPSTKKRGKLLLHLDTSILARDGREIEFVAAWPKDVLALDEPRAIHCNSCNRAVIKGNCSCPNFDYAEAS